MDTWIIIGGQVLTAIIVSALTYFFTKDAAKNERIAKYKEEKYTKLISSLQGFVGTTGDKMQQKTEFLQEEYKSWLYSSDSVVKAIGKVSEAFRFGKEGTETQKKNAVYGAILEMRKDLLGKTKLKKEDFEFKDLVK